MKKPIYIFKSGELHRKDDTIFFENKEGKKFIPIEQTSEIYVFGEVNATKKFLEFCTQKEIILHYFNHYGYYVGSYYPREHYNSGYMIIQQAKFYIDASKRLEIAKTFINGAYLNIRHVLNYYNNRDIPLESYISSIEQLSEKISSVTTIEELMGIEGNIRECYYSTFDTILQNQDFVFEKRSKQPPLNRLNALISFGNTILYTIILSEIYKTHLDPRIGFLHTSNFRRFSLNLDISEIFKPIIIDRAILKLIVKKMLTKKDFMKEFNGILLNENGRKIFIKEIEDKLATTIQHRTLNRKVSYRSLIKMEAYKLQKHLMEESVYKPFVSRW